MVKNIRKTINIEFGTGLIVELTKYRGKRIIIEIVITIKPGELIRKIEKTGAV